MAPPRRSTPSPDCSAARPLARSTGICPAQVRTVPTGPWNSSCLVMMCSGRGATPMRIGPSMSVTWLAASTTGPTAGTRSLPTTCASHTTRPRNRPIQRAHAGPAGDGTQPAGRSAVTRAAR